MAKDAKHTKDKDKIIKDDAKITSTTDVKETKAATVSSLSPKSEWNIEHSSPHHYSDMAKISAGLLIGVLALMVFLLSVGLQHPKPLIRTFLYISLATLGLNLLFYQLGILLEAGTSARQHALRDAIDADAAKVSVAKGRRALGAVRVVQQIIFAAAIIATVGFAIEASQLFFVSAAASTQAQTQAAQ